MPPNPSTAKSTTIADRIALVREELAEAARAAGRDPSAAKLIAVSKRHPAEAIRAAHAAGLTDFGENYLQEAVPKIQSLADLPLSWHYIGRIQSNKTQQIARHFAWVHTVDRRKIAERLAQARQAAELREPLNICLQVNIDADPNKAGITPADLGPLAEQVATCEGLTCRGLMTILDPAAEPASSFAAMNDLFEAHGNDYGWDTLSMGMSGDYHAAIAAGATQVRIGTAIFGARDAAGGPASADTPLDQKDH